MAEENGKSMFKWMGLILGCSAFVAFILLVLFLHNQTYDTSLPVDTGIFGTYGDFIGGVLGTVIALYTAYLLIQTFRNQASINSDIEKTNASVVRTNESIVAANQKADYAAQRQYYQSVLQIFDGKFCRFLEAYHRAIASYESDSLKGRSAFELITGLFIERAFNNNNDYRRRSASATDEYLKFYAEYQMVMSVHLRMLYLLVAYISKSELEEEDKVEYAKLVRGQMSNAEMLIVRYNCRSHFGEKMQQYCNQYNLTKHVSISSLLEFRAYRDIVKNVSDESDKLLSGIDVMFITLRKKATVILYDDNKLSYEYKTSHSYSINLECTNELRKTFMLKFKKNKGAKRRGGGARVSPEEKALDCLSESQLVDMFKDFLFELFIVSNFDQYNRGAEIRQIGTPNSTVNEFDFTLKVYNNKRLALSYIQMDNRDNSDEALE